MTRIFSTIISCVDVTNPKRKYQKIEWHATWQKVQVFIFQWQIWFIYISASTTMTKTLRARYWLFTSLLFFFSFHFIINYKRIRTFCLPPCRKFANDKIIKEKRERESLSFFNKRHFKEKERQWQQQRQRRQYFSIIILE